MSKEDLMDELYARKGVWKLVQRYANNRAVECKLKVTQDEFIKAANMCEQQFKLIESELSRLLHESEGQDSNPRIPADCPEEHSEENRGPSPEQEIPRKSSGILQAKSTKVGPRTSGAAKRTRKTLERAS